MKFKVFLILLTIYYLLFTTNNLHAASLSLAVLTPLLQIRAMPPAEIKAPIIIQNQSDESVSLGIYFKPFTGSLNQNGEINYLSSTSEDSPIFDRIQILDNNNPIQSLALGPKQQKKLFLKIDIPENEPHSDYYFSIQFISKPSSVNNNLNYSQILAGVATNVLLSIGKQNAKAVLQEFSAPLFLDKGSVQFTLKIKNTGNHFITPQGLIVIRNIFGQTVGKTDILPVNILKDSTRSIKPFLNESFLLGAYTATLNLSLSDQDPVFTKSISFFAIPAQAIITILTFLLISLLIFNRIKKRLAV